MSAWEGASLPAPHLQCCLPSAPRSAAGGCSCSWPSSPSRSHSDWQFCKTGQCDHQVRVRSSAPPLPCCSTWCCSGDKVQLWRGSWDLASHGSHEGSGGEAPSPHVGKGVEQCLHQRGESRSGSKGRYLPAEGGMGSCPTVMVPPREAGTWVGSCVQTGWNLLEEA